MNKIIDFLQSQSDIDNISENSVDKNKLSKSFNDIKNIVAPSEVEKKNIFQLKRPKTKKGQIWLCKQQYYDALGNDIIGNTPYLALVVSDIDQLAYENFVRIQPISPFIEFKANDEILVNDKTIVGFDFIIETWNEQPILTDILDEFVGNIDSETLKIDDAELSLTEIQKEFRKAEIRNTAYLRQSINSLLEYEELDHEKTIFLNIDNSIHYPKSKNIETKTISLFNEPKQDYAIAAKKGKLKERPSFLFEKTIDGTKIKIKVVQDGEKYILSLKQPENIVLTDFEGKILTQTTLNLYDELTGGLYFIRISEIENEIRIRLK